MQEFLLVDHACALLERASGVKLHRDPSAGKVKFLALGRWKGVLTQEDIPHQYIQLSNHLDFVGVELQSSFIQTRKVNGDQLQSKVKNTIGPWRAGRFMPPTMRPFSANTYALSKVWFKCSSVNLRVADINVINSNVKSWLYQDLLEKPGEVVLYRSSQDGGLGLLHVRVRATALLIRSFLETAVNPNFIHNLFHEVLFRYHVLGEDSLPDPGFTPYYDKAFFTTLQHYHDNSPLNIALMSTKQWYTALLEDQVLLSLDEDHATATLIPARVEGLHPTADWKNIWRLTKTTGLGSELSSFLFKLVHCLLPTQDRISRMGGMQGENQGVCKLCSSDVETPVHAFFYCEQSRVTGLGLLGHVQAAVLDLSPKAVLRL